MDGCGLEAVSCHGHMSKQVMATVISGTDYAVGAGFLVISSPLPWFGSIAKIA